MHSVTSDGGNFITALRPLRTPEAVMVAGTPGRMPVVITVQPTETAAVGTCLGGAVSVALDNSGSMQGRKLRDAKQAILSRMEGSLSLDLHVLSFADTAHVVGSASAGDDRQRDVLQRQVEAIGIAGGTHMSTALAMIDHAASPESEKVHHALLVTDGQTFNDEEKCLVLADRLKQRGVTISCFGTDDANVELLRQLCDRTDGQLVYLTQLNRADLAQFFTTQATAAAGTIGRGVQCLVRTEEGIVLGEGRKVYPDILPPSGTPGRIDLGDLTSTDYLAGLIEIQYPHPGVAGTFRLGEIVVSGTFGGQRDQVTLPMALTFSATATPGLDRLTNRLFLLMRADAEAVAASACGDPQTARTRLARAAQLTQLAGDSRRTQLLQEQLARVTRVGQVDETTRRTLVQAVRRTQVQSS